MMERNEAANDIDDQYKEWAEWCEQQYKEEELIAQLIWENEDRNLFSEEDDEIANNYLVSENMREMQDQQEIEETVAAYEESLEKMQREEQLLKREAQLLKREAQLLIREQFIEREMQSAKSLEEENLVKHPHLFRNHSQYHQAARRAHNYFQPNNKRSAQQHEHLMGKIFKNTSCMK